MNIFQHNASTGHHPAECRFCTNIPHTPEKLPIDCPCAVCKCQYVSGGVSRFAGGESCGRCSEDY